jgi:hypothetical protein
VADSKEQQPDFEDLSTPLDELGLGGPVEFTPFSEDQFGNGSPEGGEPAASGLPFDLETTETPAAEPGAEAAEESEGELAAVAVGAEEPIGEEQALAVAEEPEEDLAEEQPEKRRFTWLVYAQWVGAALVITAVFFLFNLWEATAENWVWHSTYWVLMALVPFVLWKTRESAATPKVAGPYNVILAIGLMAIFTAIFFLGLELARYKWDIKAKNRTGQVAAAGPSHVSATAAS